MKMFPYKKSELIKNLIDFSQNHLSKYSQNRNFDYGPPHNNVSKLSPYLRRRLISEEEILRVVLKDHKLKNIQKFVEEIFWRTYWRGWLQSHPWIYEDYEDCHEDQHVPSNTGIECFEHWKKELLNTGYLHNHSRMWFASIWVFTLGYSWQSGANFFKNNLLDYCPASNTLGWRWVAGLQTIGKFYLANAENIRNFTNERFYPKNQLNENLILNYENLSNGKALNYNWPKDNVFNKYDKLGLILNNNDLSLNLLLKEKNIVYDCCLFLEEHVNDLVNNFQKAIYEDICNQEKQQKIMLIKNFRDIYKWLKNKKITHLILPYETVGNTIFNKSEFIKKISDMGITHNFYLREWDLNAFPHATKGFFNFKKKINELLFRVNIKI